MTFYMLSFHLNFSYPIFLILCSWSFYIHAHFLFPWHVQTFTVFFPELSLKLLILLLSVPLILSLLVTPHIHLIFFLIFNSQVSPIEQSWSNYTFIKLSYNFCTWSSWWPPIPPWTLNMASAFQFPFSLKIEPRYLKVITLLMSSWTNFTVPWIFSLPVCVYSVFVLLIFKPQSSGASLHLSNLLSALLI